MTKVTNRRAVLSPFYLLCGFLCLVFVTGGSARADVTSLVLLRPASVIILGFGLLTLDKKQLQLHRGWIGLIAAVFGLVALHLVPLPHSLWSQLPGRGLLSDVDQAAGIGAVWRPMSMVPTQTTNALFSLFVPAAVLVLAVQLTEEELTRTVVLMLVLGLLSGLIGVVQAIGSGNALYFYRVTNLGSAVGLFANRNHQALLLAGLFPALAVFASLHTRSPEKARFRRWLSAACALALIPLILVTGSRAGLVLGVVGLLLAVFVYQPQDHGKGVSRPVRLNWTMLGTVGLGALLVVTVSAWLSRSEALDRLFTGDKLEADRLAFWPVIWKTAEDYFPLGSGIGTFAEVYQIVEPDNLLKPQYLNHAHNDWLEVWLTGGVLAVVLVIAFLFIFLSLARPFLAGSGLRGSQLATGRLGVSLILMILLASIVDYPLRTPIISSIFVLAGTCMSGNTRRQGQAVPADVIEKHAMKASSR